MNSAASYQSRPITSGRIDLSFSNARRFSPEFELIMRPKTISRIVITRRPCSNILHTAGYSLSNMRFATCAHIVRTLVCTQCTRSVWRHAPTFVANFRSWKFQIHGYTVRVTRKQRSVVLLSKIFDRTWNNLIHLFAKFQFNLSTISLLILNLIYRILLC